MTSIKDVAKLAEVSTATVSRCLNNPDQVKEKTRTKVLAAIKKTGYAPNTLAQNFRRGKTNLIMVVLPVIGDPFFAKVMQGIKSVASEKHYSILIHETQSEVLSEAEYSRIVVSKQADGIILLASVSPFSTQIVSETSPRRVPMVLGCEAISPELIHLPSVHIDNFLAAKEATEYLISLGHRSIAFIFGSAKTLLTKDRENGYRQAMKNAQLNIKKGWVVEGKLTLHGAIKATRKLLNHPHPPSAIFCANDEMAIAAISEIKAAGLKIPQDISVIGFDDIRYAEVMDPPLTTTAQPTEEIGERTMYKLCHLIEGGNLKTDSSPEIVQHKLIIRRSTGPVKNT